MIVSLNFIIFLLIVLCSYYIVPVQMKKIVLFIANILFYASFGMENLLILGMMILLSYVGAQILKRKKDKRFLGAFIVISLLPLAVLKYCNFTSFAEPIGVSFFTFKVISYLVDTYQGKIQTGYSLLDYSIFVSFFPTITSGPIDRAEAFLKQLGEPKRFVGVHFWEGLLFVLWGYFQKMIIADRLAIIVSTIFDNYQNYAGFPLFVTGILYTLQIYFDFAGYTHIALGIAKALGFECQQNFRQPYFSTSIREFWQRWHMSLSGWLKDYVYIPLGGNRKGTARKYVNLMITFLVSGIWHGAGWNFVAWGLLHGIYQVIGALTEKTRIRIKERLHIRNTWLEKGMQMLITFMLVNFAWVLFRGNGGLLGSMDIIRNMFAQSGIYFSWLRNTGVSGTEFIFMLEALSIALFVDFLRYHHVDVCGKVYRSGAMVRYSCAGLLFLAIILWGIYGPGYDASAFIYFQF